MSFIYLASPFFTPMQNEVLERVEHFMRVHGVSFYSPRLQDGNFGDVPPEEKQLKARQIFHADVLNVFRCGAMLAYTDGEVYTREDGRPNICRDSGTAFEMGMLYARGLPVSVVQSHHGETTLKQWNPPLITFSSEGHGANLMIASASRLHLPTLDHVDLFLFEARMVLDSMGDDGPTINDRLNWHLIIDLVLRACPALRHHENKLAVDALNP